jgi:hypothetical protein
MATKVKALETGFYGGRRYRAGDEFILQSSHKPGKWMEILGHVEVPKPKAEKPKAEKPAKEPATFSELNAATKTARDLV